MQRYKLVIEYDGSSFAGWQRQSNAVSIQGAIENAIKSFSGQQVTVSGAGRTDAGVHAFGQVAHFDSGAVYPPHRIRSAINHFCKPDISVLSVELVPDTFHARFSAIQKSYCYKMINRAGYPALMKNRAWWIKDKIDLELMKKAADILVGKHDFTSFRASCCQSKSPIRTLESIQISSDQDDQESIELIFQAKSFLHNQIRIMVSALKDASIGKISLVQLEEILRAKNRQNAIETAPAFGLYLQSIRY